MKDANELMVVALQMYRLLEGRRNAEKPPLDLIEKGAVMAIVNSLFQAEIAEYQEQSRRTDRQRELAARAPAIVADEYQQ